MLPDVAFPYLLPYAISALRMQLICRYKTHLSLNFVLNTLGPQLPCRELRNQIVQLVSVQPGTLSLTCDQLFIRINFPGNANRYRYPQQP